MVMLESGMDEKEERGRKGRKGEGRKGEGRKGKGHGVMIHQQRWSETLFLFLLLPVIRQ